MWQRRAHWDSGGANEGAAAGKVGDGSHQIQNLGGEGVDVGHTSRGWSRQLLFHKHMSSNSKIDQTGISASGEC